MSVILPYDFNTDTLTLARLQEILDLLASAHSQIGDEDILAGAGILQSKLATLSGTLEVDFPISISNLSTGWPASGSVIGMPTPIEANVWTVAKWKVAASDIAAQSFSIDYGYNDPGTMVWTQTTQILTTTALNQVGATGKKTLQGTLSTPVVLGTVAAGIPSIAVISRSADVGAVLDAGYFNLTLSLTRTISI